MTCISPFIFKTYVLKSDAWSIRIDDESIIVTI